MTISATDVQKTKFQKFVENPLKEKATQYLNLVIAAAELDVNEIGVAWGITVCTDGKSILRVNVSNRYLADVFVDKFHPKGRALMCLIDNRKIRGPKSMQMLNGFKTIKDSKIVICDLGTDSTKLISEKVVQSALKAHANSALRNLPNANWHNPLSESLISRTS